MTKAIQLRELIVSNDIQDKGVKDILAQGGKAPMPRFETLPVTREVNSCVPTVSWISQGRTLMPKILMLDHE